MYPSLTSSDHNILQHSIWFHFLLPPLICFNRWNSKTLNGFPHVHITYQHSIQDTVPTKNHLVSSICIGLWASLSPNPLFLSLFPFPICFLWIYVFLSALVVIQYFSCNIMIFSGHVHLPISFYFSSSPCHSFCLSFNSYFISTYNVPDTVVGP